MLRNFDYKIPTLDGGTMTVSDTDKTEVTLGRVAVQALMGDDTPTLTGEDKLKRYLLAARISIGGLVDVSAEEIVLIKRLIGETFKTAVVGPVYVELERTQVYAVPEEVISGNFSPRVA